MVGKKKGGKYLLNKYLLSNLFGFSREFGGFGKKQDWRIWEEFWRIWEEFWRIWAGGNSEKLGTNLKGLGGVWGIWAGGSLEDLGRSLKGLEKSRFGGFGQKFGGFGQKFGGFGQKFEGLFRMDCGGSGRSFEGFQAGGILEDLGTNLKGLEKSRFGGFGKKFGGFGQKFGGFVQDGLRRVCQEF